MHYTVHDMMHDMVHAMVHHTVHDMVRCIVHHHRPRRAQVHRATLQDGRLVVVKVQRENLRELFDIDLANIALVAKVSTHCIGMHRVKHHGMHCVMHHGMHHAMHHAMHHVTRELSRCSSPTAWTQRPRPSAPTGRASRRRAARCIA